MDKIEPGAIVMLIGRRHSGKSYCARQLLYTLKKRGMEYGVIFSGTEEVSPFFSKYFPSSFIHNEEAFNDDMIGGVLDIQMKKCEEWRNGRIENCPCYHCQNNPYNFDHEKGHCIHNNLLLITDDMMSQDKLLRTSKNYKKIFVNGRHSNLLYVCIQQYCMGLPPVLRSNIDYVFLYREMETGNLKKLYENYAGVIPTFAMFRDLMKECTQDYGCLVIDKRSKSPKLEDQVFFFRASDTGPFRFGGENFWKVHEKQSAENEKSESMESCARKVLDTYGEKGKKYTFIIE